MLPFMALRFQAQHTLRAEPASSQQQAKLDRSVQEPSPQYSLQYGAVAAVVGAISLFWVAGGRPEAGDLAARWAWASHEFWNSRVFSFFVLDLAFYYVWQVVLLRGGGLAVPLRALCRHGGLAGCQAAQGAQVTGVTCVAGCLVLRWPSQCGLSNCYMSVTMQPARPLQAQLSLL